MARRRIALLALLAALTTGGAGAAVVITGAATDVGADAVLAVGPGDDGPINLIWSEDD